MIIEVFDDVRGLAAGAAELVAGWLTEAPGPRASLGLAGGSTPEATYEQLRGHPVDWGRVDIWLSDERWVPWDHADSNGRLAAAALVDHIPARFHRPLWAPWLEPEESAARYEAQLRSLHPSDHTPDLILLGMGEDGHTASIFPGTAALEAERRWYISNWVPRLDAWRLTATLPMLHRARRVVFLIAGESKAEPLARVARGEPLPTTLVANGPTPVTFLLDRAAASLLA